MLIIIDGYNLLKNVLKCDFISDTQRLEALSMLAKYARGKRHELVIVFDAGPVQYPSRESYQGIQVIFSGQHMNADDFIISYLAENKQRDPLLVSTDKQIRSAAARLQLDSINSWDFYQYVRNSSIPEQNHKIHRENNIQVYTAYDDDLDAIMLDAAAKMQVKQDDQDGFVGVFKKTEKNKRLAQKLKKL